MATRKIYLNWRSAARKSLGKEILSAAGFVPKKKGGYEFLPGIKGKTLFKFGAGIGVGALVGGVTGSSTLGFGAGIATSVMAGAKMTEGLGLLTTSPAFIGLGAYEGLRHGGIMGGIKGGLTSYMFTKIPGPLMLGAGALYGGYKAMNYFAQEGMRSRETEFTGDTSAFETQAAYTMRQRALQEISRSHTNARTILGNEASYMHFG